MIEFRDSLLPAEYPPMVQALAAVSTRLDEIPVPIREIWSPETCPEPFLKILAHAFSVDLWNDNWPTTRKRSIIANAVRMARQKGTLQAVGEYLSYVDAKLVSVTTRPQRVFSGPSLTKAEREAWLSSLPQVRVWRISERGTRGLKVFSGGSFSAEFRERAFLQPSTASERRRRRARWVVDGVETETKVTEFGSFFRLHVRGASTGVFSNTIMGTRFFQPSTAKSRIITVAPKAVMAWRVSVAPSLQPVTAEPERVVVRGLRKFGVFSGMPIGAGYFRPSTAELRIFSRYAIHDGRNVRRRPSIQFMGVGRYGFPAHTAWLKVSMPSVRRKFAAGEGIVTAKSRFWVPHSPDRLLEARRAIRASARASDRLMLEYADRPQVIAGRRFLAGIDSFVVGRPSQR